MVTHRPGRRRNIQITRVTAHYDAVGVEIHAQAAHVMAAMLASSS